MNVTPKMYETVTHDVDPIGAPCRACGADSTITLGFVVSSADFSGGHRRLLGHDDLPVDLCSACFDETTASLVRALGLADLTDTDPDGDAAYDAGGPLPNGPHSRS